MIPSIGFMIGLYILARYSEMSKGATLGTKFILFAFSLITVICILVLIFTGASVSSLSK